MSRITTNTPAIMSQRHLAVSQKDLAVSLERLSSGLRINRGADNPAGLIVSERLRSEISAVGQAIDNSQRAINVIATTEGALDEVASLLGDINALIIEAANRGAFSDDEVAANQLQIDSAVESISRIANTTTFAGRKLLDGSLDYVTSGVSRTSLSDVSILSAKFGTRSFIPVEVEVTQSALKAQLTWAGAAIGASAVVIDLQGPEGIVTLNFPANASTNDIADAINQQSDACGVTATASAGGVAIESRGYGSEAVVAVREIGNSAPFTTTNRNNETVERTVGRDAVATINGGPTVGDGLNLNLNSFLLDVEIMLDESFGTGSTTFAVTGGGSLFQLGPRVNTNQQENIGVKSMQANKLGNRQIGFLSELVAGQRLALRNADQLQAASNVVNEVIDQVSILRGRLGAFERNALHPNINQLQITIENLSSSESVIRDTDFAEQTTELTRAQILVQAGNAVLAIANAQQQNVLSLLGA